MSERKQILLSELQRIADHVDGFVGVGALHIESGELIYLNRESLFPMASTCKIAIGMAVLEQVDQGDLTLDQMVPITADDYSPGSSMLKDFLLEPGVSLSIRNLMHIMLVISDNTATDALLKLVGGPSAVNRFLASHGIVEMSVDRPIKFVLADRLGFGEITTAETWSLAAFREAYRALETDPKPIESLNVDLDRSTPQAMIGLLDLLHSHGALSPESSHYLLDILSQCQTGNDRIKGYLPFETQVAHKSGSLLGAGLSHVTNDVGIVTLPEDLGHIALAVFIKDAEQDTQFCGKVIAHLSRAIYDYFLFLG